MEPSKPNSNFITDRPVAVLMVFVAAVVFGYFSLGQLPVTLMPEMTYPTLTVRTEYPGAAPEEVESDISRPIEEQLGVVGGLNEISSISRSGVSDVTLEFNWGTPMVDAIQDTLEKLDTVYLPQTAEKPLLLHYDPSLDPVMELSLSSVNKQEEGLDSIGADPATARRLRRIAELQVKRALEPITGVAAARVRGGLEEEIHILIDAEKLERINIPIDQVLSRLRAENINAAGGRIREGDAEYMIRTINEYENLDEIANTVVFRQDGREIRMKDIGVVVYGQKDREMLTRTNGGESVQIDIYKEADSNMVLVGERVQTAVGEPTDRKQDSLAGRLFQEEEVLLQVVADRSIFIDNSINEVKSTAVLGGLLAIVVLLFFLRDIRTTSIIAVSIPISIFVTFAPLNLMGVSLNIMSLGGLAMGIGMLVDSSIVVLESIYRCREEGDSVRGAAIRGTKEVRGAVIASTLTSICVFFPMVFVEGMAGQVFSDLGLTVVTSLIASMIVAVWFIPMLASRTGLKIKSGAGMVSHPLGSSTGRISLTTFLGKVFAPALILLTLLIGLKLALNYGSVSAVEGVKPEEHIGYLALIYAGFKWWAWVACIPLVVALIKIRPTSGITSSPSLGDLWGSVHSWNEVRAKGGIFFFIGLPYHGLRAALAFYLELLGITLVWALRGFAGVVFYFAKSLGVIRKLFERSAPSNATQTQHGFYSKLLRWALANPVLMVALAGLCVALTFYVGRSLNSELLPEVHQSEFTFEVSLPVGTPLDETVRALSGVESLILESKEELGIKTLLVMYGFDTSNMKQSDEGEHSAKFKALLNPAEDPAQVEAKVIHAFRDWFRDIPDINTRVTRPVLFSSKKPVVIEISGEDLDELKSYSDSATAVLSKSPELTDVEPTLKSGAPEVQITYDRQQMIRYGLNIGQVANRVRDMVKGAEATRLNRRDRRVPIMVRVEESDREEVADVGKLTINPGGATPIPLEAVAELTVGEGPSEIRRIDGKRVALIQSNIGGRSLGGAVESARNILNSEIDWPVYMDFQITGQNQEWERSQSSLFLALGLSLFLVYVIMASQFESLLQPFIIMFTIPMAFVGTAIGLKLLGINLSVVVFLGLIMLAGIVVNNAIVLVDYTNTLRERGLELKEAIVQAGTVRLRPILMTTATTVLGLLPMAVGIGEGAEIRTPMAITVICGLLTSTFLTLLIIPTIYYLFGLAGEKLFQTDEETE